MKSQVTLVPLLVAENLVKSPAFSFLWVRSIASVNHQRTAQRIYYPLGQKPYSNSLTSLQSSFLELKPLKLPVFVSKYEYGQIFPRQRGQLNPPFCLAFLKRQP